MAGHKFDLRADFRYGGDDNRIDRLEAEVLTGDGWQTLQIGNDSPGFLIFVYAFLICQHTYFHANSGESGLLLKRAKLELSLHTGEDWLIDPARRRRRPGQYRLHQAAHAPVPGIDQSERARGLPHRSRVRLNRRPDPAVLF
jgi:hypothetical protein